MQSTITSRSLNPLSLCLWACLLLSSAVTVGAHAQGLRPSPPTAQELAELGLLERSIQVGAATRWLLVQPPVDPSRPAPVIVLLHGGTLSMRRSFATNAGATRGWPSVARRENALLLVPNATNPKTGDPASDDQVWNDLRRGVNRESSADDVSFILAMLDWAHETYTTDRSRVYVTGGSNGGMMTFRLLMEAPERFAAAATFVASLPDDDALLVRPARPTPLLIAHGTADPLVKWDGGDIAGGRGRMRSASASVAWWIAANKASPEPAVTSTLPHRNPKDKCVIEMKRHAPQANGAVVEAYTMVGGGHAIPSARYPIPDNLITRRYIGAVCQDAEGAELAWTFMSRYRR
jgi:polyhydroxybutyrate depolymerase